jgi:hypothetical protein
MAKKKVLRYRYRIMQPAHTHLHTVALERIPNGRLFARNTKEHTRNTQGGHLNTVALERIPKGRLFARGQGVKNLVLSIPGLYVRRKQTRPKKNMRPKKMTQKKGV